LFSKKQKTVVQLLLFALLSAGVIWYMFAQMSPEQKRNMLQAIRQLRFGMIVPFIAATLISDWARAKRWQLMLRPLDIYPKTPNTLFSVLIGYLVNLVPPRAGEVAKCTVLARYEKVPADKMVGTIVAERAWDVVCLVLIMVAGLTWQASVMDAQTRASLMAHLPQGRSLLLTAGILLGMVLVLLLIYRSRPEGRLSRLIRGLASGVSSIWRLQARGAFLLYSILIWASYVIQILIGFWALPGTAHLGIGPAVMVLIFGSVAMIAAPGGLGLYPFLTALILSSGYGIPEADAQAFGWVTWGLMTGVIILLGIIGLFLLPFYNRLSDSHEHA
jgi:uncharacterized membrane protein YbhN (UPF0104 family)